MKKLRILLATGFIAILASCGPAKDTTNTGTMKDTAPTISENRGRSNQDATVNSQTNANKNATVSGTRISEPDKSPTRNAEEVYRANMQRMYADLEMNDTQIKRYEGDWRNTQSSWKRKNPNKLMNDYETIEHQDRILGDILDENQFASYREWIRNNQNANEK